MQEILRFDNGHPIVAIDPGNIVFKYVTNARPRQGGQFSSPKGLVNHHFYQLTYDEWITNYEQSAGVADNEFAFIEWEGNYYVVGKRLPRIGADNRQVGDQKYTADYMLPIVASLLLRVFNGKPPAKINLLVGHHPMSKQEGNRIAQMVKGSLAFRTPHEKFVVKVVESRDYIEIIGGVNNVALQRDASNKRLKGHQIIGGGPTLGIDLGGGTFDLVDLDENGSPTGLARTEMIGLNDVIRVFQDLVKREFASVLRQARVKGKISEQLIIDCLRDPNGNLRIGNKFYDASDIKLEASNEVMYAINSALDSMLGNDGFARYHFSLVGGGGGDVMYDVLCDQVLGFFGYPQPDGTVKYSDSVFRTGEPNEMIMANVEGALHTILYLIHMAKKRR
jgi:hypothetical protein